MGNSSPSFFDRSVPFFIFGVTAIVFLPVINWLMEQTASHDQLLHGFLVFVLTGSLLVYERRISIRPVWQFSDTSQNLLIFSYVLLVAAIFTRLNLIVLAALCLSLAALLLFVFGSQRRRLIFSSVGAFAIFTGFAVLLPVMDWPLRSIAGKCAAYGLGLIGQDVQLGLYQARPEPMLMLLNNGRPFHVAAECNGFGMISSCLLMATIIVLYRRITNLKRLGWLGIALLLGLVFNSVRIIVIVLLAPVVGNDHYMLMHEIVGLITTYGGLAVLYFLLMPRESDKFQTRNRESGL
jgi:exosortase/archaeosortase family protein